MLVVQDGGRMILLSQPIKKSTLAHQQLDINKSLISLPMFWIASCHALTFYFVPTKIRFHYKVDVLISDKFHRNIIFGKINIYALIPS